MNEYGYYAIDVKGMPVGSTKYAEILSVILDNNPQYYEDAERELKDFLNAAELALNGKHTVFRARNAMFTTNGFSAIKAHLRKFHDATPSES
jgi:hypothetical protein